MLRTRSFYSQGLGVDVNLDKAAEFFDKGCSQGVAGACKDLAVYYMKQDASQKDTQMKIFESFKKACHLKDAESCRELGIFYIEGSLVKQDNIKAKELFCASLRRRRLSGLL